METSPAESYQPIARSWDFSNTRVVADLGGGGAMIEAVLRAGPCQHRGLLGRARSLYSPGGADSSLCCVKLDPNALIKERYVGMSTAKLIQSRRCPNGNIAIRHLEYRAEKWRSITLDCHSNFHLRTPLLSV
jgi:hypothetical protein